jgi:glycerophosphoryl diester phosphodiesterase
MVHLFIRLATTAVLVPVMALVLSVTLSFSDQSALTDQDIARFLATPAGAIGGLVVISLLVVAAVLDVAAMTAILLEDARHPMRALRTSAGFAPGALPRLARFALSLVGRVLMIAAPFLAIAGVAYFMLLGQYDINYYLASRPPEFVAAVGVIALAAMGLVVVLAERLSGWAVALHLTVFDGLSTRTAFRDSRRKMLGHRLPLVGRVAIWLAIRLGAASLLAFLMGIVIAELPELLVARLSLLSGALIAIGLLWSGANALLNAVANGALADILNDEFTRALEGRTARSMQGVAPADSSRALVVLGLIALFSFGSLGLGGLALDRVESDVSVEVIGHRGAPESRPENTMASVRKAIEDGADWVEIDVQETADGEVIVTHDSDFMKAAGVPLKVWDATLADIAGIDIGSTFDPVYADERAPLLRDVLAAAKDRAKVIIELKYYGHDIDLENRVIALVEEAGMDDQIATMSLHYPAVQKMRMLRPDWRTGVLAATAVGDLSGLEGDFLAVNTGQVSASLVARAEAAGKDVYAWTVNDPTTMARMISIGVDGLITDDPDLAGKVIAYYATLSTPERIALTLADRIGVAFDLDPPEELRP